MRRGSTSFEEPSLTTSAAKRTLLNRASSDYSAQQPGRLLALPTRIHTSLWRESYFPAYGVLGVLTSISALAIPVAMAHRGASASHIGFVMSSLNAGALTAPLWGRLADNTRAYRAIFSLGFILIGLSFVGLYLASHLWALILVALIQGAGVSAAGTLASLLVVVGHAPAKWDANIGWLQTYNTGGQIIGLTVCGWLPIWRAFQLALLLSAVATILAVNVSQAGPVSSIARQTSAFATPTRLARRTELFATPPPHHLDVSLMLGELRGLLVSRLAIFLAGWFVLTATTSAFFALYPVLMPRVYGTSAALIANVYALAVLATLPLYSTVGRLAERFGPVLTLRIGAFARMSAFLALGFLAFASFSLAPYLVLTVFAALQILWPFLGVSATDLAARLSTTGRGAAIGIFNGVGAVAGAVGALLGGFCATSLGYWSIPFFSAVGAGVCWTLSSRLLLRVDSAKARQPHEACLDSQT